MGGPYVAQQGPLWHVSCPGHASSHGRPEFQPRFPTLPTHRDVRGPSPSGDLGPESALPEPQGACHGARNVPTKASGAPHTLTHPLTAAGQGHRALPPCSARSRVAGRAGVSFPALPVLQTPGSRLWLRIGPPGEDLSPEALVFTAGRNKRLFLGGITPELMILNKNQAAPHGVSPGAAPAFPGSRRRVGDLGKWPPHVGPWAGAPGADATTILWLPDPSPHAHCPESARGPARAVSEPGSSLPEHSSWSAHPVVFVSGAT